RRDALFERTLDVGGGNRVRRQQIAGAVAAERVPRVAIGLHRERHLPRLLQRDERVREVIARSAVDLAGRESLAIEENLKREVVAARQRRRFGLFLLLNGLVRARTSCAPRLRDRRAEALRHENTDERNLNSIPAHPFVKGCTTRTRLFSYGNRLHL